RARRPDPPHRHQRHPVVAAVRGHGLSARRAGACRHVHRPPGVSERLAQLRRSPLHAGGLAQVRRDLQQAGQRHLSSGPHGDVLDPGSDAARQRQPHAALRRRGHAGHRRHGLDVAVAMGGGPYFLTMPAVTRVWLTGALRPWVTAKDVILELLRRYSVRGGLGKIFEYGGPGVKNLLAAQRMTIANMGAELTLTTSVFPSDEVTRSFFTQLGRADDWRPAVADDDAVYDDQIELDLGAIGPLVALPGSPDRVVPVEEVAGTAIDQVMVGSCTNGSWLDMASVTDVLRGRQVHPSISFVLFPGSHRILETMSREGLLSDLLAAGATVSEPTCGSC